ncbi:MAG: rod shape-determining protein MreC [Sphingomonadaceae bacterium]|nr:rod shape-determining protein MreC [Sphingomonadaceae bacterium]
MASSQGERRSYARRAQYGAFAGYVVAVTGAIIGLFVAIIWAVDPVGFAQLRLTVAEVTAPVARVASGAGNGASGLGDGIAAWWRAGSQNAQLRADLGKARRQVIRAAALEAENRQLRALLNISRTAPQLVAAANLLSTSASSTRRIALIDAGSSDGVAPGQGVRSADGLVGRTMEVGPSVARVLLLADPQSVVPARRARDGLSLIVTGRGDDLLDVRPLNAAGNVLRVGDLVHTSGTGGLFQPNIPVGIIVRLTSDGGLARPLAAVGSASGVIVERAADAGIVAPPVSDTTNADGTGAP